MFRDGFQVLDNGQMLGAHRLAPAAVPQYFSIYNENMRDLLEEKGWTATTAGGIGILLPEELLHRVGNLGQGPALCRLHDNNGLAVLYSGLVTTMPFSIRWRIGTRS